MVVVADIVKIHVRADGVRPSEMVRFGRTRCAPIKFKKRIWKDAIRPNPFCLLVQVG